nr:sulfotransferase domain-containing protein [Anaerolineae bacterium]
MSSSENRWKQIWRSKRRRVQRKLELVIWRRVYWDRLPHFIIIGAPKCGTTYLKQNIKRHPDTFVVDGEPHFYNSNHPIHTYVKLFKAGRGLVRGEKTPEYCIMHPERIRFLRSLIPDVKLLFIMRNPVERAWSMARERFIKHLGMDIGTIPEEEMIAFFEADREAYRYETLLDRWLTVFPEEQFKAYILEDIVERYQEALCEAFEFIGVTTQVNWDLFPYSERINIGPRVTIPEKYRSYLKELHKDDIQSLRTIIPEVADKWD